MDAQLHNASGRLEATHWWYQGRRDIVRAVLSRQLEPNPARRILDVGCGTGAMLPMLREFGLVEGMELSPLALKYCRERVGDSVVLHEGGLPDGLPRQKYDVLTAFDVLEHLQDPVTALVAMRGALGSDGTVVCTVPAYEFLWSHHDDLNEHERRYTRPLLRQHLEKAGFQVLYVSHYNTLLMPPVVAARLLERVRGESARKTGGADLQETPRWANALLHAIFASERWLLPRMRLPFGISIIAVAKPGH
jgi:2-polyprenyl-3-methyl-5-hydroxy-6-metoxy-1,4-benzoquinol methylase